MKNKTTSILKILIIILTLILIVGIVYFLIKPKDENIDKGQIDAGKEEQYTKVEEDGTIINTSEKLNEDKLELGFEITNINLKEEDGNTILTARIKNKTGSTQKNFFGKIVMLDKQGNVIGNIPVSIYEIKNEEVVDIETRIDGKYVNAYNFRLENY